MQEQTQATENGAATAATETASRKRGKFATTDLTEYPFITWKWSNGDVERIDVTTFPDDVIRHATLHGFTQKLRDSYAASATLDEARSAFGKTLDAIKVSWTARVEGAPREEPVELLAQAITLAMADYGKPVPLDAVKRQVEGADRAARAKYKTDPKVSFHLANLKAKADEVSPLAAFGL